MGDTRSGATIPPSARRRSVTENQSHPDAVALLAASLALDGRAQAAHTTYFAVAALGSVAASAVGARLQDAPVVLAGAPGLVVATVVGVVLTRHRHWLALGEALRERYERRVFEFPDWTSRSPDVAGRDLDIGRTAAEYLARDGHRRDVLARWFTVDPARSFDRQVLQAQYESVVTGSVARRLWSLFLAFVVLLATIAITILSWVSWPPTLPEVSAWITALLPLGAAAVTAARSWLFARDRHRLADEVAMLLTDPGPDPRVMTLLVEERLVALRRRRTLVPAWFFRTAYGAIRRESGLPPDASPGLVR